MAKDKRSFILYMDQRGIFDKLSDEQAGKLIKHIYSYCADEDPEAEFIIDIAFEGIKQSLKRDLKKYHVYIDKQRENGKKGGRPKKTQKTQYRSFAHLYLSLSNYQKLNSLYSKEQIDETLDAIENFKQNTKYKSLYLTAKNWLKRLPKDEKEDKLTKQAKELGYVK